MGFDSSTNDSVKHVSQSVFRNGLLAFSIKTTQEVEGASGMTSWCKKEVR